MSCISPADDDNTEYGQPKASSLFKSNTNNCLYKTNSPERNTESQNSNWCSGSDKAPVYDNRDPVFVLKTAVQENNGNTRTKEVGRVPATRNVPDASPVQQLPHRRGRKPKQLKKVGQNKPDGTKPCLASEPEEEQRTKELFGNYKATDTRTVVSKPLGIGARQHHIPQRPKRDSGRKPNYTDEIMLCKNIDELLDKEIPNVDSRSSLSLSFQCLERPKRNTRRKPKYTDEIMLCENIDELLETEIPRIDSANSVSSTIVLPRPKSKDASCRVSMYTDEKTLAEIIGEILDLEIPYVDSRSSLDAVIEEILSDEDSGSTGKRNNASLSSIPRLKKEEPVVEGTLDSSFPDRDPAVEYKKMTAQSYTREPRIRGDVHVDSSNTEVESCSSGSSIKKHLRPMAVTPFFCAVANRQQSSPERDRTASVSSDQVPSGFQRINETSIEKTAVHRKYREISFPARKCASDLTAVVYNSDELKLMAQIEAEYGRE